MKVRLKNVFQWYRSHFRQPLPIARLCSTLIPHVLQVAAAGKSITRSNTSVFFKIFLLTEDSHFFLLRKNQASVISVTILIEFAGGPIICKKKYNNKNV